FKEVRDVGFGQCDSCCYIFRSGHSGALLRLSQEIIAPPSANFHAHTGSCGDGIRARKRRLHMLCAILHRREIFGPTSIFIRLTVSPRGLTGGTTDMDRSKVILLADDEVVLRNLIRTLLHSEGYESWRPPMGLRRWGCRELIRGPLTSC